MIVKKLINKCIIILAVLTILLSGCDKDKAVIFMNSKPINAEMTPSESESVFETGQKVYFVLYNPKPFTSFLLRIQILKMNKEIGPPYAMYVAQGRDFEIDPDQNYALNSFCLYLPGTYRLRIFSRDDLVKPLAEADFELQEP